ncbi:MAG: M14 family zinc carboxypeptidase [Planctomycetota bacterium]|nr:M14 family zinc carboxypeptidase [Planctomycetota bacterium]
MMMLIALPALLASLGSVSATVASPTPPEPAPLQLPLLDQDELSAALARLGASPNAEPIRIGHSRAGVPIDGLRLFAGDPDAARPAILLVANLDGSRVFTTSLALDLARRLLEDEAAGRTLLERADVFVVPRLDPDAAAARFLLPLHERLGDGLDRDTDRDGVAGEDGPTDIDGDGMVTMMRVPDPDGAWIADPFDARANVEADTTRGERGMWKLMVEGFDQDGDDRVAEDWTGDGAVNRNFPAGFVEHDGEAGLFPGDEPGARALMEFVLAHPRLVAVMTLDGQDTLVDAPEKTDDPSSGGGRFFGPRTAPDGKVLASDAAVLADFGRTLKDLAKQHELELSGGAAHLGGSFQRWAYEHRGILTLDCSLWTMPTKAPKVEQPEAEAEEPEPVEEGPEAATADHDETEEGPDTWREASDDVGRLAWVDATGEDHRFIDWTPFDHPTLGPVEIGGWAPYAHLEPPVDVHQKLADVHYGLLCSLANSLPSPAIVSLTAEHLGKDLWRVEARLENDAVMPLPTRAASRARTATPARANLVLPDGAHLIAGELRTLVRRLDRDNPSELSWLVHTKQLDGLALELVNDITGRTARYAEVKEESR